MIKYQDLTPGTLVLFENMIGVIVSCTEYELKFVYRVAWSGGYFGNDTFFKMIPPVYTNGILDIQESYDQFYKARQ